MPRQVRTTRELKPVTGFKALTIPSVPELVTSHSQRLTEGFTLHSPSAAPGIIYVSENPNMTAGVDANTGFPIFPGETIKFPCDRSDKLYVQTDTSPATVLFYFV